jgi:hypothetical protein
VLGLCVILSGTAFAQLSGTKWIVSGVTATDTYPSMTAAINDLNTYGVGPGGVTFNVTAGQTFDETPPAITATGTLAGPIVFQKNGSGANPLVRPATAGTKTTTTIAYNGDAVIKIGGGDYITFDAINIQDTFSLSATVCYEYGYLFTKASVTDGSKNCVIKNCNIQLKKTTGYSAGICVSNSDTAGTNNITVTSTGGRTENIKIYSNTISNVYHGIVIRGYAASTSYDFYDHNIEVGVDGGNQISNYGGSSNDANAIYATFQNNLRINNNNITGGLGTTGNLYGIYTAEGDSSNVDIIGNKVSITSSATSTSRKMYGICNGMGRLYNAPTNDIIVNINSNVVYNCTYTSTTCGQFYGINSSGSPATVNIIGDTVRSNILPGTAVFYGIYENSSPIRLNITNNYVYNNKRTGASGIMNCIQASSASIYKLSGNYVYGCSIPNTSGTTSTGIYGLRNSTSPTVESIVNNNVYNLFIGGAGTYVSYYIYGISSKTKPTSLKWIYGNNVYACSTHIGVVYGIENSACLTSNIYNNKIYNLSAGAKRGKVYGIYNEACTTANIYNNFISDLRTPAADSTQTVNADNVISGIYITADNTTVNAYYNTIYLNATSNATTTFGTSGIYASTTPTVNLRDNVVVNISTPGPTGYTVAYRRSSTTLTTYATSSNNNCWYAGVPNASHLILYDGTASYQTLAAFKTLVTPRDAQSVTELPPFVNAATRPYNIHISTSIATRLESGARPIAGITTDIDGDIRVGGSKLHNNVAPDIGADEFSGIPIDELGPTITYTPLPYTSSFANRTLTATIIDPVSGVSVQAGRKPTLFFNKNRGTWYQDSLYAPPYIFTFDMTKVSGVVAGDTIFYYVQAYDSSGNVSVNPGTAPTTANYYIITQASLSGNYTVGLAEFNRLTGRNIYFERSVRKVTREIQVPVNSPTITSALGKGTQVTDAIEITMRTEIVEVEEINWIPMEKGKLYTGDLYIKKSENPDIEFSRGTDGNYATITAAVTDLNLRGVSGPTNFLLVDATYPTETYPIIINIANEIKPTATNRVTIKPNTGMTSTIAGASAAAQIFRIVSSYITIDGSNSGGGSRNLTIQNTSITTPQVIAISPSGITPTVGVTVMNCIIINGINSSSAVVVGNPGYFNDITIQNNSIQLAYIGLYVSATVATGNGSGTLITGNDLNTSSPNAIRLVGIYVQGADGAMVTNNNIGKFTVADAANVTGIWFANGTINSTISCNTIDSINGGATGYPRGITISTGATNSNLIISGNNISRIWTAYSSSPYGIYLFSTTTGAIIEQNKVSDINNTNTGGYGARGIHIYTGIASSNIIVRNNFVWNVYATANASTTFWGIGIGIEGATAGVGVYYNSVNLYGTYAGYSSATVHAAFAVITSTAAALDVRDNIFVNTFDNTTSASDVSYAINSQAPNTVFTNINNNDYYVSGTPGVLGYLGGTQLTLAAWRTATGQDANSISADPLFTSPSDLHIPLTVYSPINRAATPISGITVDIDNEVRNATLPDIGADEYTPPPPQQFSLISPLNNSINQPLSGQLVWSKSTLAQYYDVYLDTLNPPINTISHLQIDTTYNYSGLLRGKWYYWKVAAYNDTGVVAPPGSEYSVQMSEIWSFRAINIDVGCTKIIAPTGTFDSIAFIVPACSLYNFGTTTENYTVRMKIGAIYNNVMPVTDHAAGTYKVITFPNWVVQRGTYAVTCSTELATDMYPNNDKATSQVTVAVRDVATTMIVSPTGTLLQGTTYPVHAKVKNLGTNVASFTARFKIGTIYNQVTEVSELYPNEEREIAFQDWVAVECNYATSCSTELATDQIAGNNKVTGSITVQRHDVGPIEIISPTGIAYVGNFIIPRVKVRNFGYHTTETFNVTFKIGTIYTNTKTVTNLGPRDSTIVTFDQWEAVIGQYGITTYSSLTGDQTINNDTLYSSLLVEPPVTNVGTVSILAPVDTIPQNVLVTPRAIVKNFGSNPATFTVRFRIDDLYNQVDTVYNLAPNAQQEVVFPVWQPVACNHIVSCSTEYALDVVPENDKVTTLITVQYRDVGVVATLVPHDTVVSGNDYTPAVIISNNGIHSYAEICTLSVKISRYPIRMESSYCNVGPDTMNPVVVYDTWMIINLPVGVDTIYLPIWHPYWWDLYWVVRPSYHIITVTVNMGGDMYVDNNTLTSSLVVKGISNDLQMNWTGLLDIDMPMHAETIGVKTYNVASVVSTSPGGNDARFRAWAKIIKEDENVIVYSRYKDLNMTPRTYYCVPFQSGWSATEPGWYRVISWIQALSQYDVITQNNSWEKRYYVINTSPITKTNSESNGSVQGNSIGLPNTFNLMVNTPNPFNNYTAIKWQIPMKSRITISIYDALGRNIKTLVNKEAAAGYYCTVWDRTDDNRQTVTAGIYFYEMRTDNYIARHKMVIVH